VGGADFLPVFLELVPAGTKDTLEPFSALLQVQELAAEDIHQFADPATGRVTAY
jgi:hypothetical protein